MAELDAFIRPLQMASKLISSTASEIPPTRPPFELRKEDFRCNKEDINRIVFDYLVNQGYPDAARKFAVEAKIAPIEHQKVDVETIEERVEIRNAILSGDIPAAISKINDLDPELLDRDTSLHFSILRIQLIELIRNCPFQSDTDIEPALKFAREQLAPIAPKDPSYIEDLQNAMAIMLYSPDKLDKMPADVQSLLKPDLRENIARRANEAILKQQGYPMQPKLQGLVKLRAWAERRTKETTKGFLPKELALWEQSGIAPEEDSVMGGNGDG